MPNDIRRFLQNRIRNLDILIDAEQKAIQNAPMGKISISRTHGYTQFRLLKDGSMTYIRSSETELICSLAQKLYNEKIIKVASNERECLQKCLGTLGMIPEEVLDQMDYSFIPFIKPIILSGKDYIQQWVNSDYKRKDPPVDSPFITKKGELVRSKSELLIADRLFDKGIPYRYEAELNLSGFVIHPDFTILDVKYRREVYHEHFGLMDDVSYVNDSVARVNLYSRNNIFLGDRLFVTMETKQRPLNLSLMEKMFNRFIP